MPDLSKKFDSAWVKAGLNTKQGDNLRFLDAGTEVPKAGTNQVDMVFEVAIVRNGVVETKKKFSLNRTNFKAVSALYGTNSDNWVGKEMKANVVKRQNPQSGELVKAIALSAPGADGEVEPFVDKEE